MCAGTIKGYKIPVTITCHKRRQGEGKLLLIRVAIIPDLTCHEIVLCFYNVAMIKSLNYSKLFSFNGTLYVTKLFYLFTVKNY